MPLNKAKGNMYPFVDYTWNVIKGECPHGCAYCYMKRWDTLNAKRRYGWDSNPWVWVIEFERIPDAGGGANGMNLEIAKKYVRRVLERAAIDESYAKYNEQHIFHAKEISAFISIAEFGNEEAKRETMMILENLFNAGEGKHGHSKIRNNHAIEKLISKIWERKPVKPKPRQGELF